MLLHWRWCIVDSAGGRYHANGDASTQRNHPTTSGNPARGCRHANHGPDTIASRDDSRQSTASNAHPIRPARPHPHSNQHIHSCAGNDCAKPDTNPYGAAARDINANSHCDQGRPNGNFDQHTRATNVDPHGQPSHGDGSTCFTHPNQLTAATNSYPKQRLIKALVRFRSHDWEN